MRLADHAFVVRDAMPPDLSACRRCGWPEYYCACDPEQEELPPYRGCNPKLYSKETHQ